MISHLSTSGMVGARSGQKEKNLSLSKKKSVSSEEQGAGEAMPAPEDSASTVAYSESLQPASRESAPLETIQERSMGWDGAVEKFDQNVQDNYSEHWEECVTLPEDGHYAGDPLPFRLGADDYVSFVLLLSFAMGAFFIARSQHYLWVKAKEFLKSRSRENMFNDSSDERMMGKYFFSFALCLSFGILLFNYQQIHYSESLREVSPYLLLGVNFCGLCVAYGVRTLLYAFVNSVFFVREKKSKWMESYHLLTVASTLLFFPLALLVVFYELDFFYWKILFSFSVLIVEIFLIFKTYRIFFEGFWGVLHLILYLCTLELLPLLTLWKGTVWMTQELTKLV